MNVLKLFFLTLLLTSCGSDFLSFVSESPGAHDSISRILDLGQPVTWDHLSSAEKMAFNQDWKEAGKDIPWSYQGLLWRDRSLANRMMGNRFIHDGGEKTIPDLYNYFSWFLQVARSGDIAEMAVLSEAEKYDYLLLVQRDPNYLRSKDFHNMMLGLARLKTETKEISPGSDSREANRERLARVKTFLESQDPAALVLRRDFPLVVDGWHKYVFYASNSNYSLDGREKPGREFWSWMGHCNGWATASAYETEPKHAVRVVLGGQEFLFLEHDIRSWLVKSWTHHMMPNTFLGTKCDLRESSIARDKATDRMLDGVICDPDNLGSCFNKWSMKNRATWFGDKKEYALKARNGKQYLAMTYHRYDLVPSKIEEDDKKEYARVAVATKDPKKMYALPLRKSRSGQYLLIHFNSVDERMQGLTGYQPIDSKVYRVVYNVSFDTEEELQDFADRLASGQNLGDYEIQAFHDARCRDINPMTFHLAMSEYINDGGEGRRLIIDNTPGERVWNVPVIGYESKFIELPNGGTGSPKEIEPSENGAFELVRATRENYPLYDYKAPGTRYIARIKTRTIVQASISSFKPGYLTFTEEWNEQSPDVDARTMTDLKMQYYLEFDYEKNLIGGEWDPEGLFNASGYNARNIADYLIAFTGMYDGENREQKTYNYFKGKTIQMPLKGLEKKIEIRQEFGEVEPQPTAAITVPFRQDLMREIHKCSIDESKPVNEVKVGYRDRSLTRTMRAVEYVDCEL